MATITVAAQTVPNYTGANGSVVLRLYAPHAFLTSTGAGIVQGTPTGDFYKEVECTVTDGVLTIAEFTIDSTSDSLDKPETARWAAAFVNTTANRIVVWETFKKFRVPATPTSTYWKDIKAYTEASEEAADTAALDEYIRDTVAAFVRQSGGVTIAHDDAADTLTFSTAVIADASTSVKGVVLLSTAPVSAASPIAVGDNDARLNDATTSTRGLMTAADKTKLAGITTGATANQTDAFLLARANHTGTQAISTVSGLQAELDLKSPLASPALTGTPTAPTAASATSSTQIATTAFVHALFTDLIGTAPANLDTLQEIAAQLATDESAVSALTTTVAGKLAKASNLSDLTDAAAARSNLGLGTLATQSGTFSGTSSGTNTGDQTITLTGDVTGSGTGSFATTIGAGKVTDSMLAGSISNVKLANSSVTINGTTNQINGGGAVSLGGSLTLSLPQSIHTSATPQFARIGMGAAADANALFYGSLGSGQNLLKSAQGASETSGVNLCDIATTWNNAANTPTAIKLNVTDTASNAASLLMDLQVGGNSKFKVDKAGNLTLPTGTAVSIKAGNGTFKIGTSSIPFLMRDAGDTNYAQMRAAAFLVSASDDSIKINIGRIAQNKLSVSSDGMFGFASTTNVVDIDAGFERSAAGLIAVINGTTATYRDMLLRGLRCAETSSDPSAADLTSGSNAKDRFQVYMKSDKIVIAYNNAGTVTYISLPLDGSTTTWTHSTTAP